MKIPFAQASIGRSELAAVARVLKSGWLTAGEETEKFECEFASYVGSKYAVSVNSCTSALFLSLKSLGIGEGDEIIVPSFTFAATANVVVHCGAKPVFVDITEDTFLMDQKSLDRAINKRTKAVIPVHYGGNVAKIKTNLPIIEDSAHLIPFNGYNTKAFSACYSFYATKNITTGEGGMIAYNDDRLTDWLKAARLHGLSSDAMKRYQIGSRWTYQVEFSGYKMNTTDLNSAIGRVQLKKLSVFESKRKRIVEYYNKLLGLKNQGTHLYPVLVSKRDEVFFVMKSNQIGCSFHFPPLHLQPAFTSSRHLKLPVTEFVGKHVVTLPLDARITFSQVRKVAALVKPYLLKT